MTEEQERVIRECQQSAPVDITELATRLGLTVYNDADLDPGISGMISRDLLHESPSGFTITVNANEPYLRQRFTIAHECAHFLRHRDKIGDGIKDDPMYRSVLNDEYEFEANNLAADLLMPKHLVIPRVKKGYTAAADLARTFQVSVAAMNTRLKYLYRFAM